MKACIWLPEQLLSLLQIDTPGENLGRMECRPPIYVKMEGGRALRPCTRNFVDVHYDDMESSKAGSHLQTHYLRHRH